MNGVRILVSNDINNTNTVLNGEALDLFDDENIQITLKQTDIRDIATNYTDFTQSFTVPASPKNNRIFKFWADINNDGQFESVSGIPCRIDIGGIFFKKGTIKINSAQLDDYGNIKHYAIEFTANLKSLKDKFDDTKLGQLNYTSVIPQVEIPFTDTYVRSKILNTSNDFIEFPIVSTTRLLNDFNALKYVNSSTANGITKAELRPAIKVKQIFKAIEDNYNVKFTGNFYDVDSPLDKMYLWLNKNEQVNSNISEIVNLSGTPTSTIQGITFNYIYDYYTVEKVDSNVRKYVFKNNVTVSNSTVGYKLFLQEVVLNSDGTIDDVSTDALENDGFVASTDTIYGNKQLRFDFDARTIAVGTKKSFRLIMEASGNINLNSSSIRVAYYKYTPLPTEFATLLVSNTSTAFSPTININDSLPEISIYDFYSSIIKMFNLVIIPISDPVILSQLQTSDVYQIEYFNKYYGKLNEIDITDYTKKAIKINKVNTFKKYQLKHTDSSFGTNILYKNSQNPTREYGSINENAPVKSNGGDLTIETKLGLLVWRKLPNVYSDADDYELNETWIIADGLDEGFDKGVFNKPVIFFSNGNATIPSGKRIAYTNEDLTSVELSTYNIFSNVDNLDILNYKTSLSFSNEYEFESDSRQKTLFSNNYKDLLSGIYSPYAREYEVTAQLPKHIYTTLNLGCQLIIKNQRYNITDITLNLINGEAKLKLNNVIEESNIIEIDAGSDKSLFSVDTISTATYNDFTEKVIKINYPINTAKLKWRANYSIGTSASGYKVSFSTTAALGSGGLLWYDFYESTSSIGNHSTTINQFTPVGTYTYDTATSYATPITGYMRSKFGNSLTITVIAYDNNDNVIAQSAVSV